MTKLAALKIDCIQYVEFKGVHHPGYPDFFLKALEDQIWEDEYRYPWVIEEGEEKPLTENEDIFLINSVGLPYLVDLTEFAEKYYPVNRIFAAPKGILVEYIVYSGEIDTYPQWFLDEIGPLDPSDFCSVVTRFIPDGEPIEERYVVLRNRTRDVKLINFEVFVSNFYYRGDACDVKGKFI